MNTYTRKHVDVYDLPLSLVAAHIHVFVALSWKQLYQRSVISVSAHIHQDYRKKERKMSFSYTKGITNDIYIKSSSNSLHTFSRVAMRSMAKVTRCSTVKDTRRNTMTS